MGGLWLLPLLLHLALGLPPPRYRVHRLETLCPANGSKVRSSLGTEVNVFTFNSSSGLLPGGRPVFSCHLELFLPSSLYGFSVFIEEMSLGPHSTGGCRRDYLQFGRDILFLTTHRSRRYCGNVEEPVSMVKKEGTTSFTFPTTPLASRIYTEEDDMEMDVWLQTRLAAPTSLTLVVTPFRKSCGGRDPLYRQCRYSTKCVRKELFCDGRINCAWPYSEPADEVYCRGPPEPKEDTWSMGDVLLISLVVFFLFGVLVALGFAIRRFTRKQKEKGAVSVEGRPRMRQRDLVVLASTLGTDGLPADQFLPTCPPPPPYTEGPPPAPPRLPRPLHPLPALPPPSYTLLMPRP